MNWVKNDDGGMLKPGDIFEKYRVEKLLGKGGMGAVYLVRHNVLEFAFRLEGSVSECRGKKQTVRRPLHSGSKTRLQNQASELDLGPRCRKKF